MRKRIAILVWVASALLLGVMAAYVTHVSDPALGARRRPFVFPRDLRREDTSWRSSILTMKPIDIFLYEMDSLRKDSSGKAIYDSICFRHPGLMDSAREAAAFLRDHLN
jgi:hypothetical protein